MPVVRGRGVEHAARSLMLDALSIVTRNPGPIARPDWSARDRSALVMRPEGVGDLILTTGLLRAIREHQPRIVLDVLTTPNSAPVLENNPHVRRVHLLDPAARFGSFRALPALRAERYDVVVDAMVAHGAVKTRTIMQMIGVGAPYRVGVTGRENTGFYTLPVTAPPDGAHQVEYAAALAAAFGVPPDADLSPRLYMMAAERAAAEARWMDARIAGGGASGPRVLINVSVSPIRAARRRWATDRFVALAAHVRERHPDAALLVLSLPHDEETARRAAAAGRGRWAATTLRDTFALVEAADTVFSPDTGVVHVASAFRTPVVVATLPEALSFTPYRVPGATLVTRGNVLDEITLDRVAAAMDETIAQHARERAARRG